MPADSCYSFRVGSRQGRAGVAFGGVRLPRGQRAPGRPLWTLGWILGPLGPRSLKQLPAGGHGSLVRGLSFPRASAPAVLQGAERRWVGRCASFSGGFFPAALIFSGFGYSCYSFRVGLRQGRACIGAESARALRPHTIPRPPPSPRMRRGRRKQARG